MNLIVKTHLKSLNKYTRIRSNILFSSQALYKRPSTLFSSLLYTSSVQSNNFIAYKWKKNIQKI